MSTFFLPGSHILMLVRWIPEVRKNRMSHNSLIAFIPQSPIMDSGYQISEKDHFKEYPEVANKVGY